MSGALISFDYLTLNADDQQFVKGRANGIRELAKRTVEAIVQIGQWLTEIKAKLPRGSWLPWLQAEFGWSADQAQRFMRCFDFSENRNLRNLEIAVSALYLLAAPKTPESVREEILRRAQNGEPITHATVAERLKSYRENSKPTPVQNIIDRLNFGVLAQQQEAREKEAKLQRQLGLQVIDSGYKAQATKLHPDMGGSAAAMARLNQVRNILKRAISNVRSPYS